MMRSHSILLLLFAGLVLAASAFAANAPAEADAALSPTSAASPWLLVPTVSSDPKLGTSIGVLAGYLVQFDEGSPTSMFGALGAHSSTDSTVGGLFARIYLAGDQHRLTGVAGGGVVYNDYSDFLDSGLQVRTTDRLRVFALRYLKQMETHWYLGVQALSTNYAIAGNDSFSQAVLDRVGLVGFDSVAIGLVGQYDSRDNQNSPSRGLFVTLHNTAYRESLGGDESFDAYMAELQAYYGHGEGSVLAARVSGRWTDGAPPGGMSSIALRGYVRGQYLDKHTTSIELDERIPLSKSWGASLYAGLGCLYANLSDWSDRSSWYPAVAGGISYLVKPEERMVVRLDAAFGRGGNRGLYLKFGQPF